MKPEKIPEAFARRQRRMGEIQYLKLADYQVNVPPTMRAESGWIGPSHPIVTSATKLCVMGSCMGRELKTQLIADGFNVLERGQNPDVLSHGSAEWERVYTTRVMLQETQRILGILTLPTYQLDDGVIDPHRKGVMFATQTEADTGIASYVADGRAVLEEADVLVLTLGLSEGWRDVNSGLAFSEIPPMPLWRQVSFEPEILSTETNARNVEHIIDLVREVNPELKVILGVEPQGLRATFVDRSVYVSDAVSKASLVLACHEVVGSRGGVYYFPSWEAVTYGPHERFDWDGRHLTVDALREVIATFRHCFAEV